MASFRDLLKQTKSRDPRGRHRRRPTSCAAARAPSCSTSASPTSTSRAPSPARSTSPGPPRDQHREPGARPRHAAHRASAPAASARPSPPRRSSELGYTDVVSVAGGFNKWKDEGRDWRVPRALTPEQRNRYQRHLLLPEVGVEGQLKLLDAKVLLLGAGGLGSPAALYLAAAGVGTHRHHRHGRGRRLEPAAPDPAQHRPHRRPQGRLGQEDAHAAQPRRQRRHLRRAPRRRQRARRSSRATTSIVDGADNFPTRYLVNDASVKLGIPVVHGSIFRFEGMVTVFDPKRGPDLPRHGARAAAGRAGARRAPRPACSACCPASSARSRPSRPSS